MEQLNFAGQIYAFKQRIWRILSEKAVNMRSGKCILANPPLLLMKDKIDPLAIAEPKDLQSRRLKTV
jgi:hypothetical protein